MKITILPSEKGDCMLLEASDGTNVLIDGGMARSYKSHVRPVVGKLKTLDLVYVSHIDEDHIAGVLQLVDDVVAWRVHDFRKSNGEKSKEPKFPRPPEIKRIWHNAFHEQLKDNAGEIESMLAAASAMLSNSGDPVMRALALEYREIAVSVPQAIRLSRRVSPAQLAIPLNGEFGGQLAMVREGETAAVALGSLAIRVIGPFEDNLKKLREDWNKWLRENKKRLLELRREAREDEELLKSTGLVTKLTSEELGNRKKVTAPNLASLMLVVEEGGKRVVLTGDGHQDEILKGLKHHGLLRSDGTAHFDVLKIQHHGSEHNMDEDFPKLITADNYIFCGNGEHENPDFRIVDIVAKSRVGTPAETSGNPEVGQPFTFWFNSCSTFPNAVEAHMKKVEARVAAFALASGGRMKNKFLKSSPLQLVL